VRLILRHWLIFLALFALVGEPLVADAHLSIDDDICSVASRVKGSNSPKSQQHQHNHDCCVAIAVFSKTGASDFSWRAEPYRFAVPVQPSVSIAPAIAWQLRPSRAPPLISV
jgi:hypothetical protein